MEQKCKRNIDNSGPPDNPFPDNSPDYSANTIGGLIPIGVPVRRVVARALAKARLREIGIVPTDGAAAILTRTQGRVR